MVSNDVQDIRFSVVFLDSDEDYDSTLSEIKNFYKSLTNCDRIENFGPYDWRESSTKGINFEFAFGIIESCIEEIVIDSIKSIKEDKKILECIRKYLCCIRRNNEDTREKNYEEWSCCRFYKSMVYFYSAVMKDPERRLGEAVQAGYFSYQGEKVQPIKKLLEKPLKIMLS